MRERLSALTVANSGSPPIVILKAWASFCSLTVTTIDQA
jgi:hypothetical protein